MNGSARTASRSAPILLMGLLAMAACEDEPTAPQSAEIPFELQDLDPGIHPVLSIPRLGDALPGDLVELKVHLRAVQTDDDVASYQGELTFDPDALRIVEGSFPEGLLGAWHEVAAGRVRFAGVSIEGLGDEAGLTLVAEVRGSIAASGFGISLEEVVSGSGFADLTAQVVNRGAPIVTRFAFTPEIR